MNSRFIVIDGKTYKSVEEMPEDVRRKYEEAMRKMDMDQNGVPDMLENMNLFEDKNKDGMPDAFEGLAALAGKVNVINSTKILANGQAYDSVDQMPPDVRAKYEQAMGALDADRNGIPDFMEGKSKNQPIQMSANASVNIGMSTPSPASRNPMPASQTIEPESTGGWVAALAGIALVVLCLNLAAAGVWYFFLR